MRVRGLITSFAVSACFAVLMPVIHYRYKRLVQQKEKHLSGEAIIYTWYPNLHDGCIGHQSILIKKANNYNQSSTYVSFWPNAIADESINLVNIPAKFMDADAEFRKDIDEDIKLEGKNPDDVTVVKNLNFDAMNDFTQKMQQDVKDKKLTYKFCRRAPDLAKHAFFFFHANNTRPAASPILVDPFSDLPVRESFNESNVCLREVETNNCTGVVRNVLESGGFPKKTIFMMPWGDTPFWQKKEIEIMNAVDIPFSYSSLSNKSTQPGTM